MSKKAWFLLFNLGTALCLVATGSLSWDVVSIISFGLFLLIINGIAWFSARKYKEWKDLPSGCSRSLAFGDRGLKKTATFRITPL
jgi:hypothetical protein